MHSSRTFLSQALKLLLSRKMHGAYSERLYFMRDIVQGTFSRSGNSGLWSVSGTMDLPIT